MMAQWIMAIKKQSGNVIGQHQNLKRCWLRCWLRCCPTKRLIDSVVYIVFTGWTGYIYKILLSIVNTNFTPKYTLFYVYIKRVLEGG
jgi:hypothetical protein